MTQKVYCSRRTPHLPWCFFGPILLMMNLAIVKVDAFCDELPGDSWASLVSMLEDSKQAGVAFLCPFRLEGDACPDSPDVFRVLQDESLFVVCASFLSGGRLGDDNVDCVIDCPNVAFLVESGGDFVIEALTIKGAAAPAIYVEADAQFSGLASVFDDATGIDDGGILYAEAESTVFLENCQFRNTAMLRGGALYNNGDMQVSSSDFTDLSAMTGGAIYSGPDSTTTITSCRFSGNRATEGGAIYAQGTLTVTDSTFEENAALLGGGAITSMVGPLEVSDSTFEGNQGSQGAAVNVRHTDFTVGGNYGCNNHDALSRPPRLCNGIEGNAGCTDFESVCNAPTRAPTVSPSKEPTTSPTDSLMPSTSPTGTPSVSPTPVPSPTPTATPSAPPSPKPSAAPTVAPSVPPTPAPSSPPTVAPSVPPTPAPSSPPTVAPTGPPSSTPTRTHSTNPTRTAAPSAFPSDFPSDLPSLVPTFKRG